MDAWDIIHGYMETSTWTNSTTHHIKIIYTNLLNSTISLLCCNELAESVYTHGMDEVITEDS
jgi:hypothetical protein